MHVPAVSLLLMFVVFHSPSEASKENVAPVSSNHDSQQHNEVAPTRVKRGNYNMMRLTRGLNMLRLGKRGTGDGGYPYSQYQDLNRDNMLALEKISQELQQPYVYDVISPEEYYKELLSLQDDFHHFRYRRSTPSDNVLVTPAPLITDNGDVLVDDNNPDTLKIDGNGDDAYLLFPDEGDDSVVVDDNGKLWDVKSGDELNKRGYNGALNMLRLGKRQRENLNSDFTDNKRSFNILRLGKRNLNMLRLGKRQPGMENEIKRNLNMLRLGKKRNLNMLRLGKRQLNMLRLGKRQLNMLRLGKRQLNMLRLGKREDMAGSEASKRNLNMLRLGKRQENGAEKINYNKLRLGKRSVDNGSIEKEE